MDLQGVETKLVLQVLGWWEKCSTHRKLTSAWNLQVRNPKFQRTPFYALTNVSLFQKPWNYCFEWIKINAPCIMYYGNRALTESQLEGILTNDFSKESIMTSGAHIQHLSFEWNYNYCNYNYHENNIFKLIENTVYSRSARWTNYISQLKFVWSNCLARISPGRLRESLVQ